MSKPDYDIEKYLRGEMSPEEMHALERKALDDPFLVIGTTSDMDGDVFRGSASELAALFAGR